VAALNRAWIEWCSSPERAGTRHEPNDETIVETQAPFIERVMFAPAVERGLALSR
jgi:hypothetical protein